MQVSDQITHMDSDIITTVVWECIGEPDMKKRKVRFPCASDAFCSLSDTCNQNDKLHVKLTFLILQCMHALTFDEPLVLNIPKLNIKFTIKFYLSKMEVHHRSSDISRR